ncbi:MAG TPA: NHL repeat-containing protein [Nitrospirota bacterium]|nr:NHL repeat-containing protein [Nitrospirota bacterium]
MMKNIVLIAILLLPVPAMSAEVMQLRHVASIYTGETGTGREAAQIKINQPEGVACSNKSLLLVSDTANGRLQPYTVQDDGTIKPGPGSEIKVPYPMHVRLNSKGDIFVLDGKQRKILRLNAAGELKGNFEPEGVPEPGTWIPKNFAIGTDDTVYILDVFSSRVLVVSAEGKFQRQIGLPTADGFFSDLAVDPQGRIFILNSVTATVYTAGPDEKAFSALTKGLKDYVTFPTALTADKQYIYIVDQFGSGIVVLGKDGSFKGRKLRLGWKEGELHYPSDICLNEKGEVFIADRGNNRVQMYRKE